MHQLPAGTVVAGRYEILEVIGQGGFGITYKGYDALLDVSVAVKEYYPSDIAERYHEKSLNVQVRRSENEELFEKGKKEFLKEARILARFSEDPNVVGVRDFFEDNHTVYIVMQYLEGENLKEYTDKNGTISFDEAFEMLRPVMQSLGRIHVEGLIHRDISPSNLILMRGGKVKLIDFGTAREISPEGEKSLSVMLKPGYAPPEQYQRRGRQGPWTDVYALCASIYRLITGLTPDNSLNRMLEDELRLPSECGAKINAAQEKVLMRGLAVRGSERIRDMESLEREFEAASRVPDPADDKGAEYDEEVTVMGPSGASSLQKKSSAYSAQAKGAAAAEQEKSPAYAAQAKDPAADEQAKHPAHSAQAKESAVDEHEQAKSPLYSEQGKSPAADEQQEKYTIGKKQANARRGVKKEKKPREVRGKDAAQPGKKLWKMLIPVCILAAALVIGILYMASNGTGGGEISDWMDGTKRVKIGSSDKDVTVTKSMLNQIDRNNKVAALRFYKCNISDEMIEKLASMKRISEVEFDQCTGFSTLTPLSKMTPLRKLSLSESLFNGESAFDGSAMFASDIPQLTKFSMTGGYQLQSGLDFLQHFPGLELLNLSNLKIDGGSGKLPENPALEIASIYTVDLTGVDLSAFGKEPQLEDLTLKEVHLTDLTFLKTAAALETLDAEDNQLESLDGLQEKENLKTLYLNRNQIKDISALSASVDLHSFYANDNRIEDISVLSNCSRLTTLELGDNQIKDASSLSACPGLNVLNLSGNRIEDLSGLSGCEGMTYLDIRRNMLSDLKFCEKMLSLKDLRASENQISTLDGLQNVTQLMEVRLDKNQISDISLLAKNDEHLEIAVLDGNQISDLAPLETCVNLKGLSVNDNRLTELNALSECSNLYFLSASGNRISDISGLESLTTLYMADLGENQISDVSALGASKSTKMALLLQNNRIRDISPLYGMKDYAILSLYGNEITDISGMPAMTAVDPNGRLYLDWWDGLTSESLSEIPYRSPRLVDTPLDKQMNLQNRFEELRRESGKLGGSIEFLTTEEADEEIRQLRTEARVSAGIEKRKDETEE